MGKFRRFLDRTLRRSTSSPSLLTLCITRNPRLTDTGPTGSTQHDTQAVVVISPSSEELTTPSSQTTQTPQCLPLTSSTTSSSNLLQAHSSGMTFNDLLMEKHWIVTTFKSLVAFKLRWPTVTLIKTALARASPNPDSLMIRSQVCPISEAPAHSTRQATSP